MNAYSVMNNAPLVSQEIFPFAFTRKSSCCDKCKIVGTELHLFKTALAEHAFTHPTFPTTYPNLQAIPTEFLENEDLMMEVKVVTTSSVKDEWFCGACWCKILNLPLTNNSVKTKIKEANPTFDDKKIAKEIKMISDNELLFKTHRVKKTQEKAKLYEDWVYDYLRTNLANVKQSHKNTSQAHQDSINQFIQKKKKSICSTNSRHWIKEIRMRKISKFYADRKMPHKFYAYIASQMFNHWGFPTWEQFAEQYRGHANNQNSWADNYEQHGNLIKAKQVRCPPVPEWWNEL